MKSIAVVATVVVVAACSPSKSAEQGDASIAAPAVPSSDQVSEADPVDSDPVTPKDTIVVDPDDPSPIIMTGFWSSGPEAFGRPLDLAQFYVYPDGRVIGLRPHSFDPDYAAYELDVNDAEIDRLVELAQEVGLVGGGLQPEVPLPDGFGVEDGGDSFFIARSDGQFTARVIEQLAASSRVEAELVPDRAGYLNFYEALTPFFEQLNRASAASRESLPLDLWAIVSAPAGFDGAADIDDAWRGPDLDELDWQPINDVSLCAIVADDDWPLTEADQSSASIIDGRAVTRRPLLAHETSCDDVAELRQVLDLDGDPGAGPVGVDVHDTNRWTGGVDGPVIFGRFSDEAESALGSGAIQFLGDCLVLEYPKGEADTGRSLLVFRYRTEWLPATSGIALANGPEPVRRVHIGEQVELGGGFHDGDNLGLFITDSAALERVGECLADPRIGDVFVNQ